jgi:uncharacterized protein (TIGR02594 family)
MAAINELETFDGAVPPDYNKKLNGLREKYKDVIDPGTFTAAANWGINEAKRKSTDKPRVTDKTTFDKLAALDMDGQLTVKDVKEAAPRLSDQNYKYFFSHTQDKAKTDPNKAQVNRIIKTAASYITSSLGGQYGDTWGAERTTDFTGDMLQKWDEMKADGKTVEDFFTYVGKARKGYNFTEADMAKAVENTDAMGNPVNSPANINAPDFTDGAIKAFFDKGGVFQNKIAPAQALEDLSQNETGSSYAPTVADLSAVTPTPEELSRSPVENAATMMDMNENRNKDVVMAFLKAGGSEVDPAVTKWCAAFVNASLARSGIQGTGKLNARSYLNFGDVVAPSKAAKGDIVVLSRGNAWEGHVGFFMGYDKDGNVQLLSGNAKNRVGIDTYPASRVIGIRRPPAKEV